MSPDLLRAIEHADVMLAVPAWLIPAILGAAEMIFGRKGSGTGVGTSAEQMTPEMREIFGLSKEMAELDVARRRQQEPLYNQVQGMVERMLPIWSRPQRGKPPVHVPDFSGGMGNPSLPGSNPNKPGPSQPDHTRPYGGWQPPRA